MDLTTLTRTILDQPFTVLKDSKYILKISVEPSGEQRLYYSEDDGEHWYHAFGSTYAKILSIAPEGIHPIVPRHHISKELKSKLRAIKEFTGCNWFSMSTRREIICSVDKPRKVDDKMISESVKWILFNPSILTDFERLVRESNGPVDINKFLDDDYRGVSPNPRDNCVGVGSAISQGIIDLRIDAVDPEYANRIGDYKLFD